MQDLQDWDRGVVVDEAQSLGLDLGQIDSGSVIDIDNDGAAVLHCTAFLDILEATTELAISAVRGIRACWGRVELKYHAAVASSPNGFW